MSSIAKTPENILLLTPKEKKRTLRSPMNPQMHPVLRVLAVIAIIILLILGAWGIIVVATSLPGALSGITMGFGGTTPSANTTATNIPVTVPSVEQLAVTVPQSALPSGKPFTISWMHTGGSGEYGYTISYSCGANTNAVTMEAPLPTGSYQSVPCNTPFNYTNATSQMTLLPHVYASATLGASAQFTVSAINLSTGTTSVSGTAIASFTPAASAAPASSSYTTSAVSKGVPVSKGSSSLYASNPNGIADLAVQIISLTPTSAQFRIANIGTKTAPAGWIFTAQLPTTQTYTYTSARQIALPPGGYLINTLNWSNPYAYSQTCNSYPYQQYQTYPYSYGNQYPQNCSGSAYNYNQVFSVTADPYGAIYDANRGNNTTSATI